MPPKYYFCQYVHLRTVCFWNVDLFLSEAEHEHVSCSIILSHSDPEDTVSTTQLVDKHKMCLWVKVTEKDVVGHVHKVTQEQHPNSFLEKKQSF